MNIYILSTIILIVGCAQTQEVAKTFWGSSTRALEEARKDAIKKTFDCEFQKCFDAVLHLTQAPVTDEEKTYQLFLKNRKKKVIVLMYIPGSVDTTEVGVFFESPQNNKTTIEISSLSSNAKMTAADYIFKSLEKQCLGSP